MRNISLLLIIGLFFYGNPFVQGNGLTLACNLNYTKSIIEKKELSFSEYSIIENKVHLATNTNNLSDKVEIDNIVELQTSSQVTSFVLINAATEKDIFTVTDGMTIALSSLPSSKLNMRANTSPATVGSVKFELSGAMTRTYTDNATPYALHGDNGAGNYYYGSWGPPAVGTYTLKATPYSGSKGSGTAGTPLTISFTITQSEEPTEQYSLTVSTSGSGTVSRSPDQSSYAPGSAVTLSASPATGYVFSGWSGSASGSSNPVTVTMDGNKNVTANFTQETSQQYTLLVNTTGSGTITKTPDQSSYEPGTLVTLSAAPATGYVFSGWSGSASGSSNPVTVTMDGNKNVTANFSAKPADNIGGFISVTRLGLSLTHANLGDQPQSKVWQHDGKWWAVFPATSKGTIIWRLDGSTWTEALKISTSTNTRADCKVIGNVVHFLLYRGSSLPSEFVSVEYDAGMKTYGKWSARSSNVSLQLDSGVETATIDVDGTGRMWLVSDASNSVSVRWSDHPYSTWSQPITVASNIAEDDISAVIAMPSLNKIGVLWSNQNTQRFGFKTHTDGSSPTSWSNDEVPASQSAINSGAGMADDHLNMAIASDGTLYCAVKTGYKSGNPRIALLVRRPSGIWDNLYEVSQSGNRPIVILNEALGKVKVVYAAPNAGGIYYKESSISNISFGTEYLLINETCDYATSSKANYTSDVVIFASHNNYAYSVLASDGVSATNTVNYASEVNRLNHEFPQESLTSYPNPFKNSATVNFSLSTNSEYQIALYDMKGNQIEILKIGFAEAGKIVSLEVDGSTLAAGLYIVKLQTPTKTSTIKLMLSK